MNNLCQKYLISDTMDSAVHFPKKARPIKNYGLKFTAAKLVPKLVKTELFINISAVLIRPF